ncbi:hypothetical protein H2248_004452 [Termitomyces sp. 'cryptogamus']|nr:hypothetical protein H2248_004452 [Termitomyces sp. 'cryptogamus']
MSSPVASTFTSKVSKNPGLTIDLKAHTSRKLYSNLHSFTRQLPSAISSLSNTPALEPDWIDEDDASDCGNSDEVQYIYITSDSPFYRPPTTPRSSYITVSGFQFACDPLAEEDLSSGESTSNELASDNNVIVIVDTGLTEDPDSQPNIEWNFTETLDQVKPVRTETENEAFRAIS